MSNSFSFCCNTIVTPYNPILGINSYNCCNILFPQPFTGGSGSGSVNLPISCFNVDCSSYTPVCFTASSTNLCGYLAGIDAAICNIKTQLANPVSVTCSTIAMTGLVNCCGVPIYNGTYPGTNTPMPYNLCTWASLVDTEICKLLTWYEYSQGIFTLCPSTGPTGGGSGAGGAVGVMSRNTIVDGGNGTFNGVNTLSGLTSLGSTLSIDSTVYHGFSTNSLRVTSGSPTGLVNTTTAIPVYQNNMYALSVYVFVPTGSPLSSVISIIVNGTGKLVNTTNITVISSTTGAWKRVSAFYYPDVAQNVTVSLQITNFTSGQYVNFADLVMQPYTMTNAGPNVEYEIPQFDIIKRTYNAIASSFVRTNNISNSGLYATVGSDVIVFSGKIINTYQQVLGFLPNTFNYVYYDTWTDSYGYRTSASDVLPNFDSTQLYMYKIQTNGSVVTSVTNTFATAPYSGSNIQPGSITGNNIALNTIASNQLINTAVTPGTYGDTTHVGQFTVNSQGQLTFGGNVAIAFPVSSVNGFTGVVSLGLGNLNNVQLNSPTNGQYLKFNGQAWVNAAAPIGYYQTVLSGISTTMTQRPSLNFTAYFTVTDDNVNSCTTVTIATNSLTYDRIQKAAGAYVFIGNPTNATANLQEIGLDNSVKINGSSKLAVAYTLNTQTTTSYTLLAADFNGATIVACTYTATGAVTLTLPAVGSIVPGYPVFIKDSGGSAGTHNITINPPGGATIDGASSLVINTNYGHTVLYSDGQNYFTR